MPCLRTYFYASWAFIFTSRFPTICRSKANLDQQVPLVRQRASNNSTPRLISTCFIGPYGQLVGDEVEAIFRETSVIVSLIQD